MNTLKYDDEGDWLINELIDGDAELIQSLKHLIRTRVGEWFLDDLHGFRREVVEKKFSDRKEIIQAMHDVLYQEPRVAEVLSVEYEFNRIKRKLSIEFRARTVDGDEIGGDIDVNSSWI